jgi:uncharacterized protein
MENCPLKKLIVALALFVSAGISAGVGAGGASAGVPEGLIAYRAGNYALAIQELAEAAKTGNAEAQFLTGTSYASAKPPLKDLERAKSWLKKAAEQQYSQAYYWLGNVHMFQSGTRDEVKAAPWYGKAAERGHPEAQFLLGMILFSSKTVPQDRTEAYKWIALAARGGSHLAKHTMVKLLKDFTAEQIKTGSARADAWKRVPKPGAEPVTAPEKK